VAGKIIKCLQFLTWYPKFDYFNAQISSSIPSLLTTQNSVLTLQCFRISHEKKTVLRKMLRVAIVVSLETKKSEGKNHIYKNINNLIA